MANLCHIKKRIASFIVPLHVQIFLIQLGHLGPLWISEVHYLLRTLQAKLIQFLQEILEVFFQETCGRNHKVDFFHVFPPVRVGILVSTRGQEGTSRQAAGWRQRMRLKSNGLHQKKWKQVVQTTPKKSGFVTTGSTCFWRNCFPFSTRKAEVEYTFSNVNSYQSLYMNICMICVYLVRFRQDVLCWK